MTPYPLRGMPSRQRRLLAVPVLMRAGLLAAGLLVAGGIPGSLAAELGEVTAIPHLNARGQEGYRAFLAAPPHRAFVLAPGGHWAWRGGVSSADQAEEAALDDCRAMPTHGCVPYVIDDRVVFDGKTWPTLWGPYADAANARRAPTGTQRGQRFPDLVLRDAHGQQHKLSDFLGQVVVLHFWGSWCGPCRRELPDLQQLVQQVEKAEKSEKAGGQRVRFIFVALREPFATARDWAARQGLKLPLYAAQAGGGEQLILADGLADGSSAGNRIAERQIANKFPTTYVLDKHGLVIFARHGEASRWVEYAPFLKDAAAHSGR